MSNQSPVLSALSSNSDASLSEPSVPPASLSLPPLYLSPSPALSFLFTLFFSVPRDLFQARAAPARGAGVSNLWFNKTYISLAGVLYVPHPSPFGGFMEGLWITGWFRSPLSCLRPVQATTQPSKRLTPTGQMFIRPGSSRGRVGKRNSDTSVKPRLGRVQVRNILFINPGNGGAVLATLLM